jgi:hypothetical protein
MCKLTNERINSSKQFFRMKRHCISLKIFKAQALVNSSPVKKLFHIWVKVPSSKLHNLELKNNCQYNASKTCLNKILPFACSFYMLRHFLLLFTGPHIFYILF